MRMNKLSILSLVVGGSAMLAACGGNPPLNVSGTAATGLALDGATITATCKSGNGTATSNASGTYSVTVVNGEGPCLIKAVKGTTTLYSVSTGVGANQTANVTPLTNLFVTYLLNSGTSTPAASPEAWFATSAVQATLADTAKVTTYIAPFIAAVNALPGASAITIPTTFLSTAFVAGSTPTSDPLDIVLEALKTAAVVTATGAASTSTSTAIVQAADTVPGTDGSASGASGASGASQI